MKKGEYNKVDCDESEKIDEEDRRISQMGYFGWRPRFLERFNTPAMFTALFSLSNFFLMIPYGILVLVIPTLETVFNLNSKQTGLILIANDISGMIAAVIMTNYCGAKKIRWIGLGMIVVVIAFMFPTSTTLLVEYPQPKNLTFIDTDSPDRMKMMSICGEDPDSAENDQDSEYGYAMRNHKYFQLFFFGYLLQGLGATPPLTAGVTYLDEIYSQKKFAVALASLTVFSFIGYPFAMVIGSVFLGWYVTLSMPEGMTQDSKEFVGAWWLGFFIPSVAAFFLSFLVLLYPQQMPAAKAVLKEKIEKGITTISEKNSELNQSLLQITKRMFPTFKRLLRNRALDFLIIGDVLFYLQSGINSFGPKLYEKIFRLKQTEVGKILGFFHGGGFVLGVILGGLLVRKKDWHPKKLLFIYLIFSLVSIPFILGVLLHCPTTVTKPPVSEECNSDCTCTTELYDPVCDTSTQTTYFSPCFSGCHDFQGNMSSVQQYTNCSCVAGGIVVPGECGGSCEGRMWISLVITTTHTVIKFAGFIANNVIYQRVVAESDRTVAQGLRQFARKALGTLPAPLLYGLIIDQHCNIWRKNKDGTVGNCWVYDLETMIRWLCIVQVALRLLSCGFYFLCWLAYPDKIPTMEVPDLSADNKMESSAEVTL